MVQLRLKTPKIIVRQKQKGPIPKGIGPQVRLSTRPHLEDQLHRELQLAGRAGIAGGRAGGINHPEARAGRLRRQPRVGEIGMVEQVKGLQAQLVANALRKLGGLADGQVHILEARSNPCIPAEAPEVKDVFAAHYRER